MSSSESASQSNESEVEEEESDPQADAGDESDASGSESPASSSSAASTDLEIYGDDEEVTSALSVASLPPLPDVIFNRPVPKARITIRTPLKPFAKAQSYLRREAEKKIKKHFPNLKFLLKLPSDGLFGGTVVNAVMHRRVHTLKTDEFWFKINGMITRFSMQEFVLVSGLNMNATYDANELKRRKNDRNLVKYIWPNMSKGKNVTCKKIENALEAMARKLDKSKNKKLLHRTKNRYAKLLLVLLLTRYLFGGQNPSVRQEVFGIVNDWKFGNEFDWGTKVWKSLKKHLQEDLLSKKPVQGLVRYQIPIGAWFFQESPRDHAEFTDDLVLGGCYLLGWRYSCWLLK